MEIDESVFTMGKRHSGRSLNRKSFNNISRAFKSFKSEQIQLDFFQSLTRGDFSRRMYEVKYFLSI